MLERSVRRTGRQAGRQRHAGRTDSVHRPGLGSGDALSLEVFQLVESGALRSVVLGVVRPWGTILLSVCPTATALHNCKGIAFVQ